MEKDHPWAIAHEGIAGIAVEEPMNAQQAPTILAYIKPRAETRRGWVEASVADISAATGIDLHDVAKVLHQWNKRGIVKYREVKNGTTTRLSGIRLTSAGMALDYSGRDPGAITAPYLDPVTNDTPQEVLDVAIGTKGSASSGGKAGVASVRERFRRQVLDEGIPEGTPEFEARYEEVKHKHYHDLTVKGAQTKAKKRAEFKPLDTTPTYPPVFDIGEPKVEVPAFVADRAHEQVARGIFVGKSLLVDLPLLAALSGKEDRLVSAAASIAADYPDLAEQLMARAETAYTDLEREVLTLLRRLGEA